MLTIERIEELSESLESTFDMRAGIDELRELLATARRTDALLKAARGFLNASTMVSYKPDGSVVSREVAEREAFQRLVTAVDSFPWPSAAAKAGR